MDQTTLTWANRSTASEFTPQPTSPRHASRWLPFSWSKLGLISPYRTLLYPQPPSSSWTSPPFLLSWHAPASDELFFYSLPTCQPGFHPRPHLTHPPPLPRPPALVSTSSSWGSPYDPCFDSSPQSLLPSLSGAPTSTNGHSLYKQDSHRPV